jgi:hypothetical protein
MQCDELPDVERISHPVERGHPDIGPRLPLIIDLMLALRIVVRRVISHAERRKCAPHGRQAAPAPTAPAR